MNPQPCQNCRRPIPPAGFPGATACYSCAALPELALADLARLARLTKESPRRVFVRTRKEGHA